MAINKIIAAIIALLILVCAIFLHETNLPPREHRSISTTQPPITLADFPDVTFHSPTGHAFSLKDIPEHIILVHFWAAWCAPCKAELGDLIRYVEKSQGKIALLSVALDTNYRDSQKMLGDTSKDRSINLKNPHLYWAWDGDKALSLRRFNTVKVPETIVVKNGVMIDKIIGIGPWAEATMSAY